MNHLFSNIKGVIKMNQMCFTLFLKYHCPTFQSFFFPIFNKNWEVMPWFYLKVLSRGKKLWLKKVDPSKTLTSESKQTNQNKEKYLRASITYRQQFRPLLLLLQYLSVIFRYSKASSKVRNSSWPVSIHGRSLLGFY